MTTTMMKTMTMILCILLFSTRTIDAFQSSLLKGEGISNGIIRSPSPSATVATITGLHMVKFDKVNQKWVATDPKTEGPEAGYGAFGALLRHGPKPVLDRIFQADVYEQAVLKFMAQEKCDRATAEGNMDAFRRNPNDWMEARYQMQKTGFQPDYVTLSTKKLVLTTIWTGVVIWYFTDLIQKLV